MIKKEGPEMHHSEDDLISVLLEDHDELRQLLVELEHLVGGERLQRVLAEQAIVEVVRHSLAEEAYLYPAIRRLIPEGSILADHELETHEHLERILRRLENPALPDSEYGRLLSRVITEGRVHMEVEESELFPLVKKHLSKEELLDLGIRAKQSKQEAPTRLECPGSERPLIQTILASGVGLVERVRQHLCGRDRAYPL
jgi:hemerythrin-like domain-containing protein